MAPRYEIQTESSQNLISYISRLVLLYCEAQGKGRARGGPRKVTERSFMDGGWWMVVYLSLMLYIKFGCHHHHPPPPPTRKFNFTQLMARWGSGEVGGGKGRCVGSLLVTLGSL